MQAIYYVDLFLAKIATVEDCTLQLIGMASIIMAVKINEDRYLSFHQGVYECNMIYTPEMIEKTEKTLLLLLEFKTNVPTPVDFIYYLLYLSNQTFDFSNLIHECTCYAYVCLIGTFTL